MSRSSAVLFLLYCAASAAPTAAAPSPATGPQAITHEALWLMKRVGPPAVSPDGRWAVFPVTEPAYDEKKETQDLWIVPVDGSAKARRLTSGRAGEGSAAWSPDSRRIAFTAKRDEDEFAQVYVLDFAPGGEARRVTSSPLVTRGPVWSPDGTTIAYQSAVYPGATDLEGNRKLAAERKEALDAGADPQRQDGSGWSALDLAEAGRHTQVARLLRAAPETRSPVARRSAAIYGGKP